MKIIFALIIFFIIRDFLGLKSKENKKIDSFISNETEEDLNKNSSDVVLPEIPELITQVKKLGFNVRKLSADEELLIIKTLDVVGTVPTFLQLKDSNCSLLLAVDEEKSFSFIGIFPFSEKYDNKVADVIITILNRDQNKYPFPVNVHCENNKNSIFYFFTPFFQYKEKDFEEILGLFSVRINMCLKSFFGVDISYPKFVAKRLKEAEKKDVKDDKMA